jgi:hypothetical protein
VIGILLASQEKGDCRLNKGHVHCMEMRKYRWFRSARRKQKKVGGHDGTQL